MSRCKAGILYTDLIERCRLLSRHFPVREKTVLIVRHFGAPPVIRLP